MTTPGQLGENYPITAETFSTVATTIGSLYLAAHSVVITAIGAVAATAVTLWITWLNRNRTAAMDHHCRHENLAPPAAQAAGIAITEAPRTGADRLHGEPL
jgi:hypothetical protein